MWGSDICGVSAGQCVTASSSYHAADDDDGVLLLQPRRRTDGRTDASDVATMISDGDGGMNASWRHRWHRGVSEGSNTAARQKTIKPNDYRTAQLKSAPNHACCRRTLPLGRNCANRFTIRPVSAVIMLFFRLKGAYSKRTMKQLVRDMWKNCSRRGVLPYNFQKYSTRFISTTTTVMKLSLKTVQTFGAIIPVSSWLFPVLRVEISYAG